VTGARTKAWPFLAGGVFAFIAIANPVGAFPSSRLVYARGVGAEGCPGEGTLRHAVAARLGYDPFFPSAERTIMVVIAANGIELEAKVYLVDTSGVVRLFCQAVKVLPG